MFWRTAAPARAFPRDMRRAIAYALPAAVINLPRLTVGAVAAWLQVRGIGAAPRTADRALQGCLYAHGGHGLIFVDGRDTSNDSRFVLAHEASHFILHHLEPRRRAVAAFGPQVLQILDGVRNATSAERLAGVLRGVSLGAYIHAIGRDNEGHTTSGAVAQMEADADLLAFELVAPAGEVAKRLALRSRAVDWKAIACTVTSDFGLPEWAAEAWSQVLTARYRPVKSYASWFRSGG